MILAGCARSGYMDRWKVLYGRPSVAAPIVRSIVFGLEAFTLEITLVGFFEVFGAFGRQIHP